MAGFAYKLNRIDNLKTKSLLLGTNTSTKVILTKYAAYFLRYVTL